MPEFPNLIANTCVFGGCSFGVRRQVAAFQSGAGAPHSKKWRFQGQVSAPELSAFSNKILVITEGAIRPLCGKISPIPR